jgi:hypothetical protein
MATLARRCRRVGLTLRSERGEQLAGDVEIGSRRQAGHDEHQPIDPCGRHGSHRLSREAALGDPDHRRRLLVELVENPEAELRGRGRVAQDIRRAVDTDDAHASGRQFIDDGGRPAEEVVAPGKQEADRAPLPPDRKARLTDRPGGGRVRQGCEAGRYAHTFLTPMSLPLGQPATRSTRSRIAQRRVSARAGLVG